jgi:mannose-6-phosphate isomerase class I
LSYDPDPCYPVVDGRVEAGYEPLAAEIVRTRPGTLAVDGPPTLPWEHVVESLVRELGRAGLRVHAVDSRRYLASWDEILRRTASSTLPGDPVFGRLFEGTLGSLYDRLPAEPPPADADLTLVHGTGSALLTDGALWYADLPKRRSLERVRAGAGANVGQPPGAAGSEQRLLFVDWPLLDRHVRSVAARIGRYVEVSDADVPRSLDGETLRRSLRELAAAPFRPRPSYLSGPWGGQWLRRELGVGTEAPNLAWSYELIAPEAAVLLGSDEPLEVGWELLMAEASEPILGAALAERFSGSFPLRFDYLDTLEGGHLSIQIHPTDEFMRTTFGWPYTQHESYYVVDTTPGAKIFLGLREDANVEAFRADAERAERGVAFDPERYLQAHPAERHGLYLIPAGTPHASGAGNVVLEISATPYLYTLRFYDWLRKSLDGKLRPVHVAHAFANLAPSRRGEAVRRELVQRPRVVRRGEDWAELVLGALPELFYAVHRLDFETEVADDTAGRFHVLNLVAGEEVSIETQAGAVHVLSYAETIVIPAVAGPYRIRRLRGPAPRVVKAFVR